jgi:hypothetical protein
MRLQGLALSLPLCDWRALENPSARLPFLSSLRKLSTTFKKRSSIREFGPVGDTVGVEMEHPTEVRYFSCVRALSVFCPTLPDKSPMTYCVRRVYVDEKALVRFEIALFSHVFTKQERTISRMKDLKRYARDFVDNDYFAVHTPAVARREALGVALYGLADKFIKMTATDLNKSCHYEALKPELQVIAEATPAELEKHVTQIADNFWIDFGLSRIRGRSITVDACYIFYRRGSIHALRMDQFRLLRAYRRRLRWLHAKLQILLCLARCISDVDDTGPLLRRYFAESMAALRRGLESPDREYAQLTDAFKTRYWNEVLLLKDAVSNVRLHDEQLTRRATSNLPSDQRDDLSELVAELAKIPPGKLAANRFHAAILDVFRLLFESRLGKIEKEVKIFSDSKRVDLKANNDQKEGFFANLRPDYRLYCPYVFVECKNYAEDVKNPEFDQLLCRLTPTTTQVGFIVCRQIKDSKKAWQRSITAFLRETKLVLLLTDTDIVNLANARVRNGLIGLDDSLRQLLEKVILS